MNKSLFTLFLLGFVGMANNSDFQYAARFNTLINPQIPSYTSSGTSKIVIPEKSDWNFRKAGATVDFAPSGNFLDYSLHQNIGQGATLANPNTIDSDVYRSVLLSSENSSIMDGYANTLLSDRSCSMTSTNPGEIYFSDIIASNASTISNTGTQLMEFCGIKKSSDCTVTVTNDATSTMLNSGIDHCKTSTLSHGGSKLWETSINGCYGSSISTANGTGISECASIDNSGNCSMTATSTKGLNHVTINSSIGSVINVTHPNNYAARDAIIACDLCTLYDIASTGVGNAGIYNSNTCTACSTQSAIQSSNNSNMTPTDPGYAAQSQITACYNCNITPTLGIARTAIIGCDNSTISNSNAVAMADSGIYSSGNASLCGNQNAILSSWNSNINPSTGITPGQCQIAASYGCNINPTTAIGQSGIYSSLNSATNGGLSSIISCSGCNVNASPGIFTVRNTMLGCVNCNITPTTGNSPTCGIINSDSANFGSAVQATTAIASWAASAQNCIKCLLTGQSPTVNGFNDVFACSATATASNQCIFGRRLDITGSGNNVTVYGGYVYPARGLVRKQRYYATNTTLAVDDGYLGTGANNLIVTLPDPASFSANFPLNTFTTFPVVTALGNGGSIVISGGGTFMLKAGWTTHQMDPAGERATLLFVNDANIPFWTFTHPVIYRAEASMTTANNFGLTPPKSDAAQLPTSTSQATHQALTTTSFVTFNTLNTNSSGIYSIAGIQGVTFNTAAVYQFEAQVVVRCTGGAGFYYLRADLCDIAGNTVAESYTESAGQNAIGGTRTMYWKSNRVNLPAGTYTIRLSEDSANLFTVTASILSAKLIITGTF